jgi:hypothetical protein
MTNWEIKAAEGHFYLVAATKTNNGYHKMLFTCDPTTKKVDIIMGASKNIDLWFNDRRSGSRRGRSFNPGPLIEAFSRSRFFGGGGSTH